MIAEAYLLEHRGVKITHTIMRKRLDMLAAFIESKVPDVEIKSMVDTAYYQIGQ